MKGESEYVNLEQKKLQYTYRKDYRQPDFWVDHVELEFDLGLESTTITTRLDIRRNSDTQSLGKPLVLNGDGLAPRSVKLNCKQLDDPDYRVCPHFLTLEDVPDVFQLETVTEVDPKSNRTMALGMCLSNDDDIYTQCEAESFRSFAYMIDRPDVLSTYTVTLKADHSSFPTLLSNGNLIESGRMTDGRHWARFHDPIPKPSYIFAILAGRLECYSRTFRTKSGRNVGVELYAHPQYMRMSRPAMKFVLDSMEWEEKVFDREYDLDVFRVGILNGFNGAMENKGLNLFDLNWIVIDPTNTTDDEYEYRLKTVGHEYFHNWSGDRVTIRDWFQVTLKEGLTRFRDQLFLADMTEFTSTRIKMCRHIRNNQFTEDDSSTAHPCVWDKYSEPRNLFTNTVYDKGQEIIFMLFSMLGRERFCSTVSAFFDRYASKAVTIDQFLDTFEDVGGLDLRQFRRWYFQSGLTLLELHGDYDESSRCYRVTLKQHNLPTADGNQKEPLHIPFAVGLLDESGADMPTQLANEAEPYPAGTRVLELRTQQETFEFVNVPHRPVLSRHRFFSAPVRLIDASSDDDLAFLVRHDSDLFARWDSGQAYAGRIVSRLCEDYNAGREPHRDENFLAAFCGALNDPKLSARTVADLITLPDERTLGEQAEEIDVDAVHWARAALQRQIASSARDLLLDAYQSSAGTTWDDYGPDAVGRRRLMNASLEYLMVLQDPEIYRLCLAQVLESKNMSAQFGALCMLMASDANERTEALAVCRERWRADPLAYTKWYRAQVIAPREDTAQRVDDLMNSPEFDFGIFGRLFNICEGFFYLNRYGLNEPGGKGYEVFARQMIRVNKVTPIISEFVFARSDMPRWSKFKGWRRNAMRETVEKIAGAEGISVGFREICLKALE